MYHAIFVLDILFFVTFLMILEVIFTEFRFLTAVCVPVNTTFEISNTNKLTFNWTVVDFVCENDLMNITLTLLENCLENCTSIGALIPLMDESYTFAKELKTCALYNYTITKLDAIVPNSTQTFRSEIPIENIRNLKLINETTESVTAEWSYTSADHCSTMFKITVQGGAQSFDFETTDHFKLISNLRPCVEYQLTVCPKKNCAKNYRSSTKFSLEAVVPGKITSLSLDYTSTDDLLAVKWDAPGYGAECVEYYEVHLNSHGGHQESRENLTDRIASFSNLFACDEYEVKVYTKALNQTMDAGIANHTTIPSRGLSAINIFHCLQII